MNARGDKERVPRGMGDGPGSAELPTSGTATFGFAALLAFLLLAYSRLSDVFLANLSLPLLTSIVAFGAVVFSGSIGLAFKAQVTTSLVIFTVWLAAAVPTSLWPGGSVTVLKDVWLKSFLLFVTIAGLPLTIGRCRLAVATIASSGVIVTVLVLLLGVAGPDGRIALPAGVASNPNELAMIVLIALPFVWLMWGRGRRRAWGRVATLLVTLLFLKTMLGSGSRGALLALLGVAATAILFAKTRTRLAIVAAIAVSATLAVIVVPDALIARYATIFQTTRSSQISDEQLAAAVGSTEQRIALLKQSVRFTLEHPVFGVGPGMFQVASSGQRDLGKEGFWKETHNSYTQVSSEAGIPAFLAYVAALWLSIRAVVRVWRDAGLRESDTEFKDVAYSLALSLAGYSVVSFFDSVAYQIYLPTLAGLSVALARAWEAQGRGLRSQAAGPQAV